MLSSVVASMRDAWAPATDLAVLQRSGQPRLRRGAATCKVQPSSSRPDGFCGALYQSNWSFLKHGNRAGRLPREFPKCALRRANLCGWSCARACGSCARTADRCRIVFSQRLLRLCFAIQRSARCSGPGQKRHEVLASAWRLLRRALPHRMAAETRRGGAAPGGARKRRLYRRHRGRGRRGGYHGHARARFVAAPRAAAIPQGLAAIEGGVAR